MVGLSKQITANCGTRATRLPGWLSSSDPNNILLAEILYHVDTINAKKAFSQNILLCWFSQPMSHLSAMYTYVGQNKTVVSFQSRSLYSDS